MSAYGFLGITKEPVINLFLKTDNSIIKNWRKMIVALSKIQKLPLEKNRIGNDCPEAKLYLVFLGKHTEYHETITALPFEQTLKELPQLLGG